MVLGGKFSVMCLLPKLKIKLKKFRPLKRGKIFDKIILFILSNQSI